MYTITKINGQVNNPKYTEITCSTDTDIPNLPTDPSIIAFGSTCLSINGGSNMAIWVLDEDQIWKKLG